MEWITDSNVWLALLTLTALEIVLGIDNIIFISILTSKLEASKQNKARITGLALAMIMRILLLFSLSIIMQLTEPWFEVFSNEISGRDLILIVGGLFLLGKSTYEIHDKMEGPPKLDKRTVKSSSFVSILIQIIILDIVFSLDSVITAIGMTDMLGVMVAAIIIAVIVMMVFSGIISRFVDKHPTIKILALSFLILIGVSLMADGFGQHLSKGYIYFAMAFSVFVEIINLKVRKHTAS